MIFVSYAREDASFAIAFGEALEKLGYQVWIDQKRLTPTADWLRRVLQAIVEAEFFCFVVSPDSVSSEICRLELGHAVSLNKPLVPVLLRPVEQMPGEMAAYQWADFSVEAAFESSLQQLAAALRRDPEWLATHADLLAAATRWKDRGEPWSELLHGAEIRDAEQWIESADDDHRRPTSLHRDYIDASRTFSTRWRLGLLAVVAVLVIGATLGWYRDRLSSAEASARDLALAADRLRASDPARLEESTLMSAEAVVRLGELGIRSAAVETTLRNSTSMLLRPIAFGSHPGGIGGMAVDAEQKLVATFSGSLRAMASPPFTQGVVDTTVRVWKVPSTEPWLILRHGSMVFAAAFDGHHRLIVGTLEGEIVMWKLPPSSDAPGVVSTPIRTVSQKGAITSIAPVPDAAQVIVASAGGEVCAWTTDDGKQRYCVPAPGGEGSTQLTVSPDGQYFASAGENGVIELRLVHDGQLVKTLRHAPNSGVQTLSFSPGSNQLASGGDRGEFHAWSVPEGKDLFPFVHRGTVTDLKYLSGAGTSGYLASVSGDGALRLFDQALTFGWRTTELRSGYALWLLATDPRGESVAVARGDGYVEVWSPREGRVIGRQRIRSRDVPTALAYVDPGLLVIADGGGGLRFVEVTAGQDAWNALADVKVEQISLAGNEELLAIADSTDATTEWSLSSGHPSGPVRRLPDGGLVAFDGSGRLAIADDSAKEMRIVEADQEQAQVRWPVDENIGAIAWRPGGDAIAVARRDGKVSLHDPTTGAVEKTADVGGMGLSFEFSGKVLAIVVPNEGLRLWDVTSDRLADAEAGADVAFAQFSPTAPVLFTAHDDGTLRSWTLVSRSGEPQIDLRFAIVACPYDVTAMAVSRDGRLVAAGCDDGRITIRETAGGEEIAQVTYPADVRALAFRTGTHVLLAGGPLGLRGYHTETSDVVGEACSRLSRNLTRAEWSTRIGDSACRKVCPELPGCGDRDEPW